MRVLDNEERSEMHLSNSDLYDAWQRRRFYYHNSCNFYRGYRAASAKLFEIDPPNLVTISELFATKVVAVELEYGWCASYEAEYEALIGTVKACCDEHTFLEVLTAGQAALINEPEPVVWSKPEPLDREKKRRGHKPQAWQNRMDESYGYIHWWHRTSKCWKDQSKRKRQWK